MSSLVTICEEAVALIQDGGTAIRLIQLMTVIYSIFGYIILKKFTDKVIEHKKKNASKVARQKENL